MHQAGRRLCNMARAGKSSAQGALGIDKGAQALDRKVPGVSMGQVVGGDTTQPTGEKAGDTMGTEDSVLGMEHVGDMGGRRASYAFDRIKGVPPLAEPDYCRSMHGVE